MPTPAEQPRFDQPVVDQRGLVTRAWQDYFLRMSSRSSQEDLAAIVAEIQRQVNELQDGQSLSFQIFGERSIIVNGVPQSGGVVIVTLEGDVDAPGNTRYYGTGPSGAKGWFAVESAIAGTAGQIVKTVGLDGVATLSLDAAVVSSLALANSALQQVQAGSNISVDSTDPKRPIVSADVSGSGLYPILTDQLGNPLTDQLGRQLYSNVPALNILTPMTLAAANALTGVADFQMVAITDLAGGREPCWYDSTVASGTKWRRFSDRSIAN